MRSQGELESAQFFVKHLKFYELNILQEISKGFSHKSGVFKETVLLGVRFAYIYPTFVWENFQL